MKKIPRGDENLVCPLHKQAMSEVCHKCPWWVQIRGKHPQSEQEIDDWQCAVGWVPLLLIAQTQQQHQTGAAIESFRNEMVRANAEAISYNASVQRALSLMPATGNPVRLLEGSTDAAD